MPGPPPKPAGQRRRRNAVPSLQALPDAPLEYFACPVEDEQVVEMWEESWASPIRYIWKVGDGVPLRRLARLWLRFLRDEPVDGAIVALEDRLGFSPKARRYLGVEFERGGGAEAAKAAAGSLPVDDMRDRLTLVRS